MIVLPCSNDKAGLSAASPSSMSGTTAETSLMSFFMSAILLGSRWLFATSPAWLGDMIDGLTTSRFCVLKSRWSVEKLSRALLKHGPEVIEPTDGQSPALPIQIDIDMRARHQFNQLARRERRPDHLRGTHAPRHARQARAQIARNVGNQVPRRIEIRPRDPPHEALLHLIFRTEVDARRMTQRIARDPRAEVPVEVRR